jgi:hypothetical protein
MGAAAPPNSAYAWCFLSLFLAAVGLVLAVGALRGVAGTQGLVAVMSPAQGGAAASGAFVTVVVHGLAHGWQAGEPLVSLAFRHHVLAPLLREGLVVHVLLCAERELAEGDLAALQRAGAARVEQFARVSTKWRRRGQCYQRALQLFGEPRWWVALRSDALLFCDLPPLRALSPAAIHTRARLVRWDAAPLTTAHLSWRNECVESCPHPCPLFLKQFMVADDVFAVVPHALAPAYFVEDVDPALASNEVGRCAGVFHPNLAQVWPPSAWYALARKNFLALPEIAFTCSVLAAGGVFEPLGVLLRLNPYAREPENFFGVKSAAWGVEGVMAWPSSAALNCSHSR